MVHLRQFSKEQGLPSIKRVKGIIESFISKFKGIFINMFMKLHYRAKGERKKVKFRFLFNK